MRRLIYVSRSAVVFDRSRLDDLITSSATRNAENGITGMMWFDGARFAQVLEGEHDAIEDLLGRIRADERHSDLKVVADRPVRYRAFGTWAMAEAAHASDGVDGSAFLIGTALEQDGPAAATLRKIILACEQ
jgi:hypothetical protein